MADGAPDFGGLRVVAFESRRAVEMAELIRRHGGAPLVAPSMREVDIGESPEARAFARRLTAGEIDVVILLTGVGTRALVRAVSGDVSLEEFARALGATTTLCRGPKPVKALRELGLRPSVTVPEPNTWRDLLATIDREVPVEGRRVAVQEYGLPNPDLLRGLAERGADVVSVPVYRWALPEDLGPLRSAIEAITQGTVDVALFTSATQVHHLFEVAGRDAAASLSGRLARLVVASIGPIASEALRERGVVPDLEPRPAKMGALVRETARRSRECLETKRRDSPSGPIAGGSPGTRSGSPGPDR